MRFQSSSVYFRQADCLHVIDGNDCNGSVAQPTVF